MFKIEGIESRMKEQMELKKKTKLRHNGETQNSNRSKLPISKWHCHNVLHKIENRVQWLW